MNINAKGLAVLAIVLGGAVIVAYSVGVSQSKRTPDAVVAQGQPATNIAPAPVASVPTSERDLLPQDNLPPDHPAANAHRFTHFRVGNRNVKGMYADTDAIWVGTSGGAIRYDLKKDDYKLFDVKNGSLISNGVFHISKINDRIMVGTYGGGLSAYDLKTEKWKNYNIPDGLADQFVYDLSQDPQGNLWIATWSGANFVTGSDLDNPKGWKTYTVENTKGGLPNDWVYGVEVGLNGDVWFATEGGLARLDKAGKWTNWQHEAGLGAPYEKVKDDITYTNDPAKASRHHATQKAQQGLKDVQVGYNPNYIVSMVIADDGSVWCGTWGGGLSHFDGKTWKTYTTKEGLPGNHVFMLSKSKDGKLWIGTNKGLARLKDGPDAGFTVLTQKDGLFADNVFSIAEAQDGSVWVGSFGGVTKFEGLQL